MNKVKTGVLMLNMGGPSSLEEVQPFLTRLFTDRDIITLPIQSKLGPFIAKRRAPKVIEKYKQIGGGSPIKSWTQRQGQLMIERLNKVCSSHSPFKYYIGFRYADPLTEESISQMEKDGVEHAIAFSQFPQYSCSTSGSSFNAISKYYISKRNGNQQMKWSFIDRWPVQDGLVNAFVDLIKKQIEQFPEQQNDIVILFSAHALPMSAVNKGDTYPSEVGATVIRVMESLEWKYPYRLVWQSKVGPVAWLEPQINQAIKGFVVNGLNKFLIVPISFVNEHIETLHELDIEYGKELSEKLKVNIRRCPAPNDHPYFIDGLVQAVEQHLQNGEKYSKQLAMRCPLCTKNSCIQFRQWLSSL